MTRLVTPLRRDLPPRHARRGRSRIAGLVLVMIASALAFAPARGQETTPDARFRSPETRPVDGFNSAVQENGRRRGGLRLDGGLTYGRPLLDDRGESTWERVGTFEAGAGIVLGLGYDWSRFGVSVELDAANSPIGDRDASTLSIAALAHWYPATAFGRVTSAWHPQLTIGYVRQALGGLNVTREELPPLLAAEADPFAVQNNFGVLGNGARVGIAAERALRGPFALQLGATVDVVSFGTATLDGSDVTLRPSGRSVRPRAVVGIVWRPF